MAGDDNESLRRKLRRISDNESEEPSKRHKHNHHHRRHRHRRKRNHDDKDAETNHAVEEKAQMPLTQPLVPPDDDVEEGEIREEDEEFIAEKLMDSSDAESGEIKVADADEELREEVDERASSFKDRNVDVAVCRSIMRGVEVTVGFGADAALSSKRTINGDTKMCDEFDLHKDSSVEHFCNRNISKKKYGRALHHGEDHCSNRSGSPDQAKERLQSQSIFEEASHLQVQQYDVLCNRDIRLSKDYGDETISRYENDYRHGSRDLGKEKEQGYDYSRHTAREDRYQSSDTWTRFRDKSRESWDRGREHGNRKRENNWDKVQGITGEKDRNQERERERERERRKERNGEWRRERDQDTVKGKEYDKLTQNRKHYDADTGFANRDNHTDYRHRRPDETENWSKARRNDTKKSQSSKIDDLMKDAEKRDELERENYKESTMLQLAEKEEEEDEIDRIKKESRKRKQAILDKFKTRQTQQKLEAKLEIDVKASLSAEETQNIQGEAADSSPVEKLFSVGKFPKQIGPPALKIAGSGALGEGTPKSEGSDDMFRDDIFGDSPAGLRKPDKGDCLIMERSGLEDNWDDAEGYYSYRFGEILDGRYEVIAAHGKGVFSSVVRAKDLKAQFGDPEEVAIKIIRSNDIMYKTGLEELVILKKLVAADQEDKRHCVRLISSFKYRNHLCLVFESLHMNLREVLKKFGRNIGLKLTAVRTYAKQLFIALKHLRNCGVLHCDIKPDNMLVNDAKNVLKLCDFGNAMFAGKNEVTPYLVSRFYRAPEIILGLRYDHPMDIWSVGCCLYEIYTGKVLFPGPSNNDMLRLHMELKGPFPKKMLRKGAFIDHHFDQDLNFLATEEDPVTKKTIKRLVLNIKPKDIGSIVLGSIGDDPKMLSSFKDLLEKIFALDPDKRITVSQSLGHPFITGK